MKAMFRTAVSIGAGVLAVAASYALGQQATPTDYQRVDEQRLASIDLGVEIDSVQDRELTLSRVTIEPNGISACTATGVTPVLCTCSQGS